MYMPLSLYWAATQVDVQYVQHYKRGNKVCNANILTIFLLRPDIRGCCLSNLRCIMSTSVVVVLLKKTHTHVTNAITHTAQWHYLGYKALRSLHYTAFISTTINKYKYEMRNCNVREPESGYLLQSIGYASVCVCVCQDSVILGSPAFLPEVMLPPCQTNRGKKEMHKYMNPASKGIIKVIKERGETQVKHRWKVLQQPFPCWKPRRHTDDGKVTHKGYSSVLHVFQCMDNNGRTSLPFAFFSWLLFSSLAHSWRGLFQGLAGQMCTV